MNIFKDQAAFIAAMGQTQAPRDTKTVMLYEDLVFEECGELSEAMARYMVTGKAEDMRDVLDGCIDLIYVTAGLVNALGLDGEAAWREVHRSIMSKLEVIEGIDGTVEYVARKREDGKILKPPTFSPPDLMPIVAASLATTKEAVNEQEK